VNIEIRNDFLYTKLDIFYKARISFLALFLIIFSGALVSATETLKVGVLKFGTVNWLMDVIKHHKLDEKNNFTLDVLPLASKNATSVALLSNEVDSIVTDWFWALRERSNGEDFVFFPYSVTLGAIVVPAETSIKTLTDLKGKKIGVAGGPLDKSWLLVRARAKALGVGDLASTATPVFGAPPLLNQLLIKGDIDAVLNYWHFAAKLEGEGYRRVIGVADVIRQLGIDSPPPAIGFVFREKTAEKKADAVIGFSHATRQAVEILLNSDDEWLRLRPKMKVKSDGQFEALVKHFRAGSLETWNQKDRAAAKKLFGVLSELGGEKLTGKGVTFDENIFWSGLVF
jgi:NitT/TauT family transport system substrate-binding protein